MMGWLIWNMAWTTAAILGAIVTTSHLAAACFAIGAMFGTAAAIASYRAMKGRNQ